MQCLIIGYGKMGKAIEEVILAKGYPAPFIIDNEAYDIVALKERGAQVAIEFTSPEAAPENIRACLTAGLPIVSGSTGWLAQFDDLCKICEERNGSFFYASNFSVGVNVAFYLNRQLAKVMERFPAYIPSITEIHHTEKKDKPSGTAISLAEGVFAASGYKHWHLSENDSPLAEKDSIAITALREAGVPGTHTMAWTSDIDQITLNHQAYSRKGFAEGAVMAAAWVLDKKGIFGMEDLLQL